MKKNPKKLFKLFYLFFYIKIKIFQINLLYINIFNLICKNYNILNLIINFILFSFTFLDLLGH